MSAGMLVFVYPYGQRMNSPFVWNVMWALICWIPPILRLRTNERNAFVSGAENGARPRYVIDDGLPDEPPQQPQR